MKTNSFIPLTAEPILQESSNKTGNDRSKAGANDNSVSAAGADFSWLSWGGDGGGIRSLDLSVGDLGDDGGGWRRFCWCEGGRGLWLSVADLRDRSRSGCRSLRLSVTDLSDRHGEGGRCLRLAVADLGDDGGRDLWLSVGDLSDWDGGRSLSLSIGDLRDDSSGGLSLRLSVRDLGNGSSDASGGWLSVRALSNLSRGAVTARQDIDQDRLAVR